MSKLLHELISRSATDFPRSPALHYRDQILNYAELDDQVVRFSVSLLHMNIHANDRVAVFLPKRIETVVAMFASSRAGAVFVPVNPLLKARQVSHILNDCNARVLVTNYDRLKILADFFEQLPDLHTVIITDGENKPPFTSQNIRFIKWNSFMSMVLDKNTTQTAHTRIDVDMAAILYTSGSTGKPKGVALSHLNMVTGAKSVTTYLNNTKNDCLLAVLPFSFDYGLSQLTTAFSVGASVVLLDYLLPQDVLNIVAKKKITGLAAVPLLWIQLATLEWPFEAKHSLRYITNSGGTIPSHALFSLRQKLPDTDVFLMYGLTEAFRSTYLSPHDIDKRPNSIGKAIPNVDIMVVREDGHLCAQGEPGELVHRGSLVAMGYWNDPEGTAKRFRPAPRKYADVTLHDIAVWSGDIVKMDIDGYLYFIGRNDDMIKTSGYRVSPTEVEEVIYASGLTGYVAVIGVPHPTLGHAIVAVVTPTESSELFNVEALLNYCKTQLPEFMMPMHVQVQKNLPCTPNGKIDRKLLRSQLQDLFQDQAS